MWITSNEVIHSSLFFIIESILNSNISYKTNDTSLKEINKFPDNYITDITDTFTANDKLQTTIDMEEYAEVWLRKVYGINLGDYKVTFKITDLRDKKAAGLYEKDFFGNYTISLSKFLFNLNDREKAERILIHELTHFAMSVLGKGYKDDDKDFQKECVKNGGSLNGIGKARAMYSHLEGNELYTAKEYDSQK